MVKDVLDKKWLSDLIIKAAADSDRIRFRVVIPQPSSRSPGTPRQPWAFQNMRLDFRGNGTLADLIIPRGWSLSIGAVPV